MDGRAGVGVVTAGVIAGELLVGRVPVTWVGGVAAIALLAAVRTRRREVAWVLLAMLSAAVGMARMATVIAPELRPGDVARLALPLRTTVEGAIVESPERDEDRTIMVVAVDHVGRGPATGRIRLGVRGDASALRYGDRIRFDAILRRPRNFDNPGSFDFVAHLARRGIRVTAFVWDAATIDRLPMPPAGWTRLERWRTRVGDAIGAAAPGREGAVLRALVVGDETGIDRPLREAFTRAGVVHVLSVSGLHIGLVAAAGFLVVRWLLARSEGVLLAVDVERTAAAASLVPVALYSALAGLGTATLRSALMVTAGAVATLIGRRADVLRTLALAALALALGWPGAPLEISYQLSFASVLAIVLGVERFGPGTSAGWRDRVRASLWVSPVALLGTAPLTAFHFHQVSLAGIVANPLTLPLFGGAVVIPGLLGAFVEPFLPRVAGVAFHAAALVLRPGITLVEWLAAPAWAAVDVPIPSLVELTLLYGLLAAILLLPGRHGRLLVAVALAGLLADVGWWMHERWWSGVLRVTFLDVGQGDAAVVELPDGRVMVVDAGGFPGGGFDTGAAVVGPFLYTRKILRVDTLAMTHAHPDHSGGLPYLVAHHRPREFWWTGVPGVGREWDRLVDVIAATRTRARVMAIGSTGFADVRVLHPPADWPAGSLNDSSLTLRTGLGAVGVLLTGDVEERAESALLRAPDRLQSVVLKVPHHGSRTSSTPAFLAAVAPRVAVMPVGADNRYRLPAPEVEARYRAAGVCVLRTDRCGAITIETDGTSLRIETRRCERACVGSTLRPPA